MKEKRDSTSGSMGIAVRLLPIFGLLLSFVAGCAECETSADCKSGEVCIDGQCKPAAADGDVDGDVDSDVDTDTDADTDTDTDTDTDADTDADTDTDIDTDTDSDTDTGTGCEATLLNGEACSQDCECLSSHCGDGFCCPEGECCSEKVDCDEDSLCTAYYCDGNHVCQYSDAPFDCGEEDSADGDLCTGGDLCDGFGNCVTPEGDCGWYMPTGEVSCAEGSITIECYTDCTTENQSTHCDTSAGAGCSGGECLPDSGLADGQPCAEDFQCDSGHCGDGFCCGSGECCASVSDCDDSSCNTRFCDASFQCQYTPIACGQQDDADGDVCLGGDLCDGFGNCVAPYLCDGPYAWDGTYTCYEASVTEDCHSSCTNDNQCNVGYECEVDQCVEVLFLNGASCTDDSQCESGHCGDGFCCPAGECCSTVGDCDDSLCNSASCPSPNYQCIYDDFFCGSEDADGTQTCTGDTLCDGFGNCVVVGECNGAYAWDGYYECAEGSVDESCATTCYNFLDCNDGYTCEGDQCVAEIVPNGGPCNGPEDCESGHCEGGICCPEGECCLDVSDCDDSLCVQRYCNGNNECDYYDISCGAPDTGDGDTCTNGALCDGGGECDYSVAECSGAYAWTGNYACGPAEVSEECYTTCSSGAQCNDGYYCEGSSCVPLIPEGEGVCSKNSECETGYCTPSTGICCYEGWCCNDSAQCGSFDCDLGTFSCEFSCDTGSGDDDGICSDLGDFHCDNGQCYEDLLNGESYCDEDSDCLSGHCDTSSAICCDSGPCCQDDGDCGGFACDASFNCVTDCSPMAVEDDSLCADGYHCDGSSCVSDLINGTGTCDEDSDCASGNCTESTGICCSTAAGDCCNSPSQCNDGNPCTTDYCSGTFHCTSVEKSDGESCSDGTYCNGMERCQAGICQAGTPPCEGMGTFCLDVTCNESEQECEQTPQNEGLECSEELWCLGGVAKVCNATGLCVDPGTGTPPCTGDTGNPCTDYECDEENDTCEELPVSDGLPCDDGDPCNGDADQCQLGVCEGTANPCDDGDPCTTDNCTDNGGEAECGSHDPISDGNPCEFANECLGDGATCWSGICVPGEDRPCNDYDICTVEDCWIDSQDQAQCEDGESPTPVSLTCGSTTPIIAKDFSSIEYYSYGTNCPGSYPGREAYLELDAPGGDVTVSISAITPTMTIYIMYLPDACQFGSCLDYNQPSLTVSPPAGPVTFILEAPEGAVPDSLDVTVSCP
ncbi:MAG: hypothetical protein R6V85_04705 [Polyangia bacterium]